ncbi:hypothetical protein FVA95_14760 [Pseudonocardia sp. EV170527-09]|uniref:hypothetical protein n=1 Tax=Pseudonocardia sp. EV170527-09 TaxID=2603411 RepID=UPI0011F1C9E2|nr:hypothetical protein [Pseudonocardia sp. EV170527-09]KAA1026565.1 hypothetical protein FVA95_14760 [Pseudonocardia sp. EV170527-09]
MTAGRAPSTTDNIAGTTVLVTDPVADLFNLPDLRSNASLLGFGSLRRIADAVVAGGAVGEAA